MEDFEAIKRIRGGEKEAFSLLVEKYHRRILNFIYRIMGDEGVVEDIGQEVFLSVYKSLEGFDEERGTPFSAWLFVAARNRCISELRSRRGKQGISLDDAPEIRADRKTQEEAVIEHERMQALQASLEQLPEPYKSTILRSLQGNSLDEIAGEDGVAVGTVKSRLFRAREKMKVLVKAYFGGKGYERI